MLAALCAILLVLAAPTLEQSTPISPCPNVFSYEPPGTEPGRWYGVVNLSTDSTLHSLWLNIVLDSKADILGNWVGDVSTSDNTDFKIENTEMKVNPGPAVAVRFFVQYNQLNKAPRLQAIRLNGREICNAATPQPTMDRPEGPSTNTKRPYQATQSTRPSTRQTPKPVIRPEDATNTRPLEGSRPTGDGPVYTPQTKPPLQGGGLSIDREIPSQSVGGDSRPMRPYGYDFTPSPPRPATTVSRPVDNEYFDGGPNVFFVDGNQGSSGTNTNKQKPQQCGTVTLNNPIPLVVNGTPTLEGQWPWQIALYMTQTVDNKYICGGTLVSHRHIITAAHCVTKKGSRTAVLKNTLTVYLGKHNLRTSIDGVQIRFVDDIIIHPAYNASIFSRDVSILRLREPVTYSDWVRPACLWPDNQVDLTNVVGKLGSVVGWGYDDTGVATEELSHVEMPVVSQEDCIRSYSEFFARFTSAYTYCAGFRDGHYNKRTGAWERTSVCNGDSGGGMVFRIGSAYYVRGLVSVSVARENEYRCDPTHYVIFTDLAKFLPWIRENVNDY